MTRSIPLSRKQLLILSGVATVAFDVALTVLDRRMQGAGGPSIVGFEFAGSAHRAANVMAEWGASGRHYAHWSLWLDFGFILSFGTFFTLVGLATRDFARDNGLRRLAAAGVVAPYCAAAAAVFDVVEDVFLLLTLGGHGGRFAPPIAAVCASLKFVLITIAIVYALWGLVAWLLRRRQPAEAT